MTVTVALATCADAVVDAEHVEWLQRVMWVVLNKSPTWRRWLREQQAMKSSKPSKPNNGDLTERLMKMIDLQSRVIEALAMALGAKADAAEDDDDDDEDESDADDK